MTSRPASVMAPAVDRTGRHLVFVALLFAVFGFVTWLGSVLIPYLRIACELTNLESYLVAFAFYISYFLFALPAAGLLQRTGYRLGMTIGMSAMAVGVLLFIPAAWHRQYLVFLIGLFVQGCGLAILQTAANPYVVVLGPPAGASRRMGMMGLCNSVAGILAPLVLGHFLLENTDGIETRLKSLSGAARSAALQQLADQVVWPYACMAAGLLLTAGVLYFSGLPEIDPETEDIPAHTAETAGDPAGMPSRTRLPRRGKGLWQYPHLLVGAAVLFLYVGVEVIAADTIISYGASEGIPLTTAKFFTSCTLAGMLAGYLVGIACIPRYFSPQQALIFSAIAGICFTLAALSTRGYVSISFVALLGLANSLVWPSIWPLALAGLGRLTKAGGSLLIMAIGGGAVLPLLYGRLADLFSPHAAYALTLPCYAAILYYGLAGYQAGRRPSQTGNSEQ